MFSIVKYEKINGNWIPDKHPMPPEIDGITLFEENDKLIAIGPNPGCDGFSFSYSIISFLSWAKKIKLSIYKDNEELASLCMDINPAPGDTIEGFLYKHYRSKLLDMLDQVNFIIRQERIKNMLERL